MYGREVCDGGGCEGGQNCTVERSDYFLMVRLGFGRAGSRAGEWADVWTNGPASSHATMQPCKHIRLKFNSRGGPPEAKPIYLVIFHIKIVFLTKEYFEFPMTFN